MLLTWQPFVPAEPTSRLSHWSMSKLSKVFHSLLPLSKVYSMCGGTALYLTAKCSQLPWSYWRAQRGWCEKSKIGLFWQGNKNCRVEILNDERFERGLGAAA